MVIDTETRSGIFQWAPISMLLIQPDGIILDINAVAETQLGFSKPRFINSSLYSALPDNDKPRLRKNLDSIVNDPYETITDELHLVVNGETHPIEIKLGSVSDAANVILVVIRNIEQRKKILKQLNTAERNWDDIYQAIGHPAMILDKEQRVQSVNRATLRAVNKQESELIGKYCYEIFHNSNEPHIECPLRKMRLSGRMESNDMVVDALNGTYIISCTPIYDTSGKLEKIIHIATDITATKEAQTKLSHERNLLRTLIDNLPDSIYFKDRECRFVIVNKEAARRVGETNPDNIVGKTDLDVHPINLAEKYFADDKQVLTTGRAIINKEGPVLDQMTNKIILSLATKIPLWDQGNNIIGLVGIGRNITDLRRAELELKESEQRFRAIFDNTKDGILLIDAETELIHLANRMACTILKTNKAQLKQLRLEDIHPKLKIHSEHDKHKIANSVDQIKRQVTITFNDNSRIHADIHVFDIQLSGKNFLVYTIHDITDQKQLEEELFKARKLDSLGVLAGGIAHDFNNILTGIISNITLAKLNTAPENDLYELLDDAEKAAFRATGLTQQLLTFSKGGAPVKKVVSIAKLIQETSDFAISGSNVRCEYQIQPNLWNIEVDEGQLSQVINNLVINADQAMPTGGIIRISARNVHVTENNPFRLSMGHYIKITIEDQGVGISKEHLSRIFDPYFSTKQRGSGLGLSTSYSIIKNHGGVIHVTSTLGEGTTFAIFLAAAVNQRTEAERLRLKKLIGKGHILVMDDEEIVRRAAGKMLNRLGCECEYAAHGQEAIDLYRRAKENGTPFDAVILDLTIPGGMGGEEAAVRLRQLDADVKIIVSSGYSNDPVMSQYENYGFCGVIPKPFKIETISETLAAALEVNK
ncbi:PAS domain S-box protein [candidate division KSB1 bacterium]|nr:PAS domain S-box protein [candidate division KSB1 bacterium]